MANLVENTIEKAVPKEGESPATDQSKLNEATKNLAAAQQAKDLENLKKDSTKINLGFAKLLQIYALPLTIIIIFGALIFTLIIPSIAKTFGYVEEINDLNDRVSTLDTTITNFQNLAARSDEIDADLAAIDTVIPEQITNVVAFQQRITGIARDRYGLIVNQAETGETILNSTVNEDSTTETTAQALSIIEIPSTFSIVGSLSQLKEFISAVQQTSDFIIIGEMKLIAVVDTDVQPIAQLDQGSWRLDITLVKYQFPVPNAQNDLQNIYSQVPPTVEINPSVLEYIESKAN